MNTFRCHRVCLMALAVMVGGVGLAQSAELVTLSPENYEAYAPHGDPAAVQRGEHPKPAPGPDPMWGDIVLRNDHIVAVIADPQQHHGRSSSRRGNIQAPVPGRLIGLTSRKDPNDRLRRFELMAGARLHTQHYSDIRWEAGTMGAFAAARDRHTNPDRQPVTAARVMYGYPVISGFDKDPQGREMRFILEDGWRHILVEADVINRTDQPQRFIFNTTLSAGGDWSGHDGRRLRWVYDSWFHQAYAILTPEDQPVSFTRGMQPLGSDGQTGLLLQPGQSTVVRRMVIPGRDALEVRAIANDLMKVAQHSLRLSVSDGQAPVENALVRIHQGDSLYAAGRTNASGELVFRLPLGNYQAHVSALGYGQRTLEFDSAAGVAPLEVTLDQPGRVVGRIRDQADRGLPCRILLHGLGETPTPQFFPASGETRVLNAIHAPKGEFSQTLPPGRYRLTITRGPEYDYVQREIEVARGLPVRVDATLERRVDAGPWLSAEFANRSRVSSSWSNASQLGRVLNLLVEDIRFAPSTEQDLVSTFKPHLAALDAREWMASVEGANLTQRERKAWDSQNAFPMPYIRGDQDGGLIQRAAHMLQVWWLAQIPFSLDARGQIIAEGGNGKLIQVTPPGIHPNDGRSDGMSYLFDERKTRAESSRGNHARDVLRYYDAMEVQPLEVFLRLPNDTGSDPMGEKDIAAWHRELDDREAGRWPGAIGVRWPEVADRNRDWVRILNLGYRFTGVVNSNAKSNTESGVYRNYVYCPQDRLAELDPMRVVEAVRRGRVIMTTGPLLESRIEADGNLALPGDDLHAPGGKTALHVRVQSSNWATIDEVRVLYNGQFVPSLRFTREEHPERFTSGAVQFDQKLPLELTHDTRVMVMALGRGPNLRVFMQDEAPPTVPHFALTNPIYVDVDGDGFKPHSPVLDQVLTRLEAAGTLQKGSQSPVSMRLYMRNSSDKEVHGRITLVTNQPTAVLDPSELSYHLPPNEAVYFTVKLSVPDDFAGQGVRVMAPRSSEGVGRRAASMALALNAQYDYFENWSSYRQAILKPTWWFPARDVSKD